MRRHHPLAAAAVAVLTAGSLVGAGASSSSAEPARQPEFAKAVLGKLVSPLSLDVKPNGTAYLSQNFAGLLTKKRPGHKARVIYAAPRNTEVGAVSVSGNKVTFATTKGRVGKLMRMSPNGHVRKVKNTWTFERNHNPDGHVPYGVVDIAPDCETDWPVSQFGPAKYTGIKETHPYATTRTAGPTYLADAAGNTILRIWGSGRTRTVAVLPSIPVEITADIAANLGMPDCVVGLDYHFEPVPTDVEMGPDGMLYVTSLPGGPEDGSLGANGSVFRVDPRTGDATPVVQGLVSPVGVAVARNGDLFVSELFRGRIAKVPAGTSTPQNFRRVELPGDVELTSNRLYATSKVLTDPPRGKVVKFPY